MTEWLPQFNDFSIFLCMGRYKSLGSLKSFLWYAFQWSRASILFFPILNPLRYTTGSACSGWWQPVFLCFVFPQDSPPGAAVVADGLMTPTFFVYWYGRWFFVHLWRQNCNHLPGQLNQSSCVLGEIRRRIPKSMGTWKPVRRASLWGVQDALSPLSSSTQLSSRLWAR